MKQHINLDQLKQISQEQLNELLNLGGMYKNLFA